MHNCKYAIICKLKYAQIFTKYAQICKNMQRLSIGPLCMPLIKKNMQKYARYVSMEVICKIWKNMWPLQLALGAHNIVEGITIQLTNLGHIIP